MMNQEIIAADDTTTAGDGQATARMVLIGGTSGFNRQVTEWLRVRKFDTVHPQLTSEPNVVVVEESVGTVAALAQLLECDRDIVLDDLYKAVIGPLKPEQYVNTVVMGRNATTIKRGWNNIVKQDRCLGTPPAHLAEKGW